MYKNYQLPYQMLGKHRLVECFLAYFKASFVIDLSKAHSCLNSKYFRHKSDNHLNIGRINCRFISKKNISLPLEECEAYENETKMVHGVLGRDFFNEYQLLSEDPENLMLFFFKGNTINYGE